MVYNKVDRYHHSTVLSYLHIFLKSFSFCSICYFIASFVLPWPLSTQIFIHISFLKLLFVNKCSFICNVSKVSCNNLEKLSVVAKATLFFTLYCYLSNTYFNRCDCHPFPHSYSLLMRGCLYYVAVKVFHYLQFMHGNIL